MSLSSREADIVRYFGEYRLRSHAHACFDEAEDTQVEVSEGDGEEAEQHVDLEAVQPHRALLRLVVPALPPPLLELLLVDRA